MTCTLRTHSHTHTHTRGHKEPISVGRWRAQLLRCPGNTYEFLSLSSITPAAAWYRRTGRSSPWENREREREIASTTDRTARLFSHYLNEHWRVNVGVGRAKSLFSSLLLFVCAFALWCCCCCWPLPLSSSRIDSASVARAWCKAIPKPRERIREEERNFILYYFYFASCCAMVLLDRLTNHNDNRSQLDGMCVHCGLVGGG